jgi:ornithine cyclodeaminase
MNHQTRYLDVPAMVGLVHRVGIRPLIREIFAAMREDYIAWADFEKSPRSAVHSPVGVIELMPIANQEQFSFKYVNGHPGNPALGLPTVMAFGALADVDTGYPVLLSEMTLLTGIRTAVASALAASVLARPESRVMALIGNGAQAEFQVLAFAEMIGITTVRLFDVDPAATDKVIRNLQAFPDLKLIRCASVAEALEGADIITTATADKTRAVILTEQDLRPGLHINGIGGDCPGKTELSAELLQQARVVVQYEPQSRIEGDIQQMPADYQAIELWRILAGETEGRQSANQITIFDSVGFSIEDFSALRTVLRLAETHQIGQTIPLIPDLADVKDLYGLLTP